MCLLNYLTGTVKLVIWKTRKIQGLQLNSINVEVMFMKLVAGRLKIEFAYYSLVNNQKGFSGVLMMLCVLLTMEIWFWNFNVFFLLLLFSIYTNNVNSLILSVINKVL